MADEKIQENLPIDSSGQPNNQDLTNVQYVQQTGEKNPPDPEGTLLPNSTKYTINSNQWTAVTLTPGIYNVKAREEGQVVYIASTPEAKASLRVTKNFDIETSARMAVYIKGQSVFDMLIEELKKQIGTKADIDTTYTKEQVDKAIENAIKNGLGGITEIMTFKGVLPNEAALPTTANNGDVYQIEDTGQFFIAKVTDGVTEWEAMSGSIIDLTDYLTKDELDVLLGGYATKQELGEYKSLVENFIPTFDWQQTNDPSLDNRQQPKEIASKTALDALDKTGIQPGTVYKTMNDGEYYALNMEGTWVETTWTAFTDPTNQGDTWFSPGSGLIKIRRVSNLDGSLFWYNPLENALTVSMLNYVTTNTEQIITAKKTFATFPEMQTDEKPTQNRQFVTKKYVDDKIAQEGGGSTTIIQGSGGTLTLPPNLAYLNNTQTFTDQNIFKKAPIIEEYKNLSEIDEHATVTRKQLESVFDTNPAIKNPKSYEQLADNEVITKGSLPTLTGGDGSAIDTSDFAKLSKANEFQEANRFMKVPSSDEDPASGNDLVRMSYMENALTEKIGDNNNAFYSKTEINNLLQDYVKESEQVDFMTFKGTLNEFSNLDLLPVKNSGDVYYVAHPEDKQGFYIYNGTAWSAIGTGLSINDADFAKLSKRNNFQNTNTFTLDSLGADGTTRYYTFAVGSQIVAEYEQLSLNGGSAIFSTNNIKVNKPFLISTAASVAIATFEENSITFATNPLVTKMLDLDDLLDSHLITKWQAKRLFNSLGGGTGGGNVIGGDIDLSNIAKLDIHNTFKATNTFNKPVTLDEPPVNPHDAVRKDYVDNLVNQMPNIENVYTKEEITNILKEYVKDGEVASFMEYKGSVLYYSNLPTVDLVEGCVYNVELPEGDGDAKKNPGFYIYNGTDWDLIGSATDINIDTSNLAKLNISNNFTSDVPNRFETNPIVNTPNANTDKSLITKGEIEGAGYIKAGDNITFTGDVTFEGNLPTAIEKDKDTGELKEPTSLDNLPGNSLVTKDNLVIGGQTLGYIVSDNEPDRDEPAGKLWVKKSYNQVSNDPPTFDKIPALYISVGDHKWWDLHKEELIGVKPRGYRNMYTMKMNLDPMRNDPLGQNFRLELFAKDAPAEVLTKAGLNNRLVHNQYTPQKLMCLFKAIYGDTVNNSCYRMSENVFCLFTAQAIELIKYTNGGFVSSNFTRGNVTPTTFYQNLNKTNPAHLYLAPQFMTNWGVSLGTFYPSSIPNFPKMPNVPSNASTYFTFSPYMLLGNEKTPNYDLKDSLAIVQDTDNMRAVFEFILAKMFNSKNGFNLPKWNEDGTLSSEKMTLEEGKEFMRKNMLMLSTTTDATAMSQKLNVQSITPMWDIMGTTSNFIGNNARVRYLKFYSYNADLMPTHYAITNNHCPYASVNAYGANWNNYVPISEVVATYPDKPGLEQVTQCAPAKNWTELLAHNTAGDRYYEDAKKIPDGLIKIERGYDDKVQEYFARSSIYPDSVGVRGYVNPYTGSPGTQVNGIRFLWDGVEY